MAAMGSKVRRHCHLKTMNAAAIGYCVPCVYKARCTLHQHIIGQDTITNDGLTSLGTQLAHAGPQGR